MLIKENGYFILLTSWLFKAVLLRTEDVSGVHRTLGINVIIRKVPVLNEEVYLHFMDSFSHLDHT